MRLSKIKLSGFKSFVDPTSIPLPSNLIGVVGPNGCGKSNVIDAVRWVMGESSAKHLRGDSMADVIFNGSSARKPVGQASIELLFDNSDNTIKGEYAQYNEISIRRVVTRDGQSQYYLNGTRCRRRDITGIFLGTGLGPRSYSIIEQGMISRLIEARPEDLRIFLEEAAGISKYKERRRETENRIRHTRENLDRLTDLRDELGKQLDRLQRQSRAAEKYKELKQEERLLKGQLTALRWKDLDSQAGELEQQIREKETAYEEQVARQRAIEADIEKLRDQHVETTETFNEVQGRYYSVGGDIARIEQSIQHANERRAEQEEELQAAERSWIESETHLASDRRKIEELKQSLEQLQPDLERTRSAQETSTAALNEAEQAMQDWQASWDEFNLRSAEPARAAEVERTQITNLENQHVQSELRLERLRDEHQHLSHEGLEQEIAERLQQVTEYSEQIAELQERLQQQLQSIESARETNHQLNNQLDQQRSQLQSMKGRYSSLEALQQAALGKTEQDVVQWLSKNGFENAQRLAQGIKVAEGWERAVECVLGFQLEAVCVNDLDTAAGHLAGLEHGSLTLFDTNSSKGVNDTGNLAPALGDKVDSSWSLAPVLAGVYAVDSLNEALSLRSRLASHESVITRNGEWVGANWLRVARDADEKAGVLHREQELKELASAIDSLTSEVESAGVRQTESREQIKQLETERESVQQNLNKATRAQADVQAQLSGRQARLDQMRNRSQGIEQEISELEQQREKNQEDTRQARQRLEQAMADMESLEQQREALTQQRDQLRTSLDQARDTARADRDAAHEIRLKTETMSTELTSTEQSLERMERQLTQVGERREALKVALAEGEAPLVKMKEELEQLLEDRMAVEEELGAARRAVEELDHAIRSQDTERHKVENAAQEIRSSLDSIRMSWQELKVRRQTLVEKLGETGQTLESLFESMPEEAEEESWAEQVERIENRIQRLGPINLAAIEEFQTESERKEYLDAQHADLVEALETLENAIRKIDKETRTRFKETFENVNSGFKELFPRLFGGGHAYLELTGEDLLDTGVTVMARPPGKRNSTIHLLSGGEKALTAVALVFSIFQLNPAPFCMLDEVDAPLDDANVGRFCDMVREMSDKVQFIIITHNKITMELANQLNGVTMHEPGVSRLVAVDIDEAARMVAS
jgi:chromosome segregation protein